MAEFRHIGEVKLRIDALHVHVHADRDNIHVSGSLAVSEQRSLDTHERGERCLPAMRALGQNARKLVFYFRRERHSLSTPPKRFPKSLRIMPGRTLVVDQVANDNARALGWMAITSS